MSGRNRYKPWFERHTPIPPWVPTPAFEYVFISRGETETPSGDEIGSELEEALDVLRLVEMCGTLYGNTACCPLCEGSEPYIGNHPTHKAGCKLAKLIGKH